MKRFSQQLNKEAKQVKLSAVEKADLKDRLVSYMEYHPLPLLGERSRQKTEDFLPTSSVRFVTFERSWFKWVGATAAVFVLSLSYVAEEAVPGDVLYAVKVGVNEELRSTLAVGSYDKVVWETERLNRRIAEARLLASEGRLTVEYEEQVAAAVKEHSDKARKEIAELREVDKEEAALASIQLATALDVQTTSLMGSTLAMAASDESLMTMSAKSAASMEASSVSILAESVMQEAQETDVALTLEDLPSYEKAIGRVEQETTRAKELLLTLEDTLSETEKEDLKRRIYDIEVKIGEAMHIRESDNVGSRVTLFDILQQIQRLIVFMTNLDVRQNLTVEQIVPITLTLEERLNLVKEKINQTKINIGQLEINIASATPEVMERVEFGLDRSKTLLTEIEEVLKVSGYDISSVESLVEEALLLTSDSLTILNLEPVIEGEEGDPLPLPGTGDGIVGEVSTSTSTSTEEVGTTTEPVLEV